MATNLMTLDIHNGNDDDKEKEEDDDEPEEEVKLIFEFEHKACCSSLTQIISSCWNKPYVVKTVGFTYDTFTILISLLDVI